MNPSLIIGTGGTGKWVVTYVKHALLDRHNRGLLREHGEAAREQPEWDRLPANVRFLAFDVNTTETVVAEDARTRGVEIDTSRGSTEFVDFGTAYETALATLQQGNDQAYPYISPWLPREDASSYDLTTLSGTTTDGAGQLRQLGRLSLWLTLDSAEVRPRLEALCRSLRQATDERTKLNVFIVGSVAGGTGSGTFLDLAALARAAAAETFNANHQIIGLLSLPTTFNTVVTDEVERSRMAGNGYAALRELGRLNAYPGGAVIRFSDGVSVTLDRALFDVSYIVEGSRGDAGPDVAGTKPEFGVNPAMADVIALHVLHPVDYSQVRTGMQGRRDAAYSVLGTVTYIAPIEDMIHEFSYKLGRAVLERLVWGASDTARPRAWEDALNSAATASGKELESFLNERGATHPQLLAWVDQILGSQRVQQLTTAIHFQYLRNASEGEANPALPQAQLRGVIKIANVGSKGDPPVVKAAADKRVIDILGSPGDSPTQKRPTVGSVCNLYLARNEALFRRHLSQRLLRVLNEGAGDTAAPRPGGLQIAAALLEALGRSLSDMRDKLAEAYTEQQTVVSADQRRTKLDLAREARGKAEEDMLRDEGMKDRLNNHAEQETYLERYEQELALLIQDRVHAATLDALNRCEAIAREVHDQQIRGWILSISGDVQDFANEIADIIRRRREMAQVAVRRYVSLPEDQVETSLLHEHLGTSASDDRATSAAAAALARPMSWGWEHVDGGELYLSQPRATGGHQPNGVAEWAREGLPEFQRRAAASFHPLRQLSVWDLLHGQNKKPKPLIAEMRDRSGPITAYNNQIQAQQPAIPVDAQMLAIGKWLVPRDTEKSGSASLSSEVRAGLERTASDTVASWGDPHVVMAVQMFHYVKMSALTRLPTLRKKYEGLVGGGIRLKTTSGRTPVHLIPGEREAIELELRADQLIRSKVILSPGMIARLEHRDDVVLFGRGVFAKALTQERKPTREIAWTVTANRDDDPEPLTVDLGSSLLAACDRFSRARSDDPQDATENERAARVAMIDAAERQRKSMGDIKYGQTLARAALKPLFPDTSRLSLEENELDVLMRLLLRDLGEFLSGK